ncbi:beta-1,3-glucosyltransferase [Teleopsis dalmanni]|uniref:beta-1,3-glucosyltransferase n=1 Tax=Teleopsis dalmanni TaxID=139649 RepID=UPI0018CCA04F|nr:beta-1,3-glucosyltransferase [Teleopsis dalmanni]
MMNYLHTLIVVIMLTLTLASAPIEVLILITSQDNSYHHQLSTKLRNNIISQSHAISLDYLINVQILHKIFNHPGDWSLLTALPYLSRYIVSDNTKWIILCEDSTHIALQQLLEKLRQENHTEPLLLGHALYDQEATIIHHFAFFENPRWFPYPMLRSGVIFTATLFKSTVAALASHKDGNNIGGTTLFQPRRAEFTIDAAHELALYILENVQVQEGSSYRGLEEMNSAGAPIMDNKVTSTLAANVINRATTNVNTDSNELQSAYEFKSPYVKKQKGAALKNKLKMILKKASYICPKANTAGTLATTTLAVETLTLPESESNTDRRDSNISNGIDNGKNANNEKVGEDDSNQVCAMYAKPMDVTTCLPVRRAEIYFAIKTCKRFHTERIPIIEATWGPFTVHKRYFSDVADANVPTISVGLPNVETGHCSKTLAILRFALKDIERINLQVNEVYNSETMEKTEAMKSAIQWIFLCDDDTLLSVAGICEILGCFNPHDNIYLGERYGYRLYAEDGFNYITGGGGIALSLPVVRLILQHCTCPSATAPDDMILGSCLHSLQLSAIHTPRFHQARPNDYPPALLQIEPPISFHKFWQLDPYMVHSDWFATADHQMLQAEKLKAKYNFRLSNFNYESVKLAKSSSSIYETKFYCHQQQQQQQHHRNHFNSASNFVSPKPILFPFPLFPAMHHTKEKHLDL